MPGFPNRVGPRDIRLQVLKEKFESGLKSLAFNFEMSNGEGAVIWWLFFSPPLTFSTNVSNYLFLPEQLRPLKLSLNLFIFSASGKI